jgi:hypothetical protein
MNLTHENKSKGEGKSKNCHGRKKQKHLDTTGRLIEAPARLTRIKALGRWRSRHSDRASGQGGAQQLRGPYIKRQAAGVVEDRVNLRQIDTDGRGKVVALDLSFSVLKRPGHVVQVGANGLAGAIHAEQIRAL